MNQWNGGPPNQTRLAELRIPESSCLKTIYVNGAFGSRTESGVKLFRVKSVEGDGNFRDVDGFVEPLSWETLFGAKIQNVKKTGSPLLDAMIAKASLQVGVFGFSLGSNCASWVDKWMLAARPEPTNGSLAWCAAILFRCYQKAAKNHGVPNPMSRTAGVLVL